MSTLETRRDGVTPDLVLRDGSSASIKILRQEDRAELRKFVDGLSEETLYYRFLTSGISKDELLRELLPRSGSYSLVAVRDGVILGLASYIRSGPETAEMGLIVLDGYQGSGLGTGLTERIARAANQDSVSMFEAIIDWNNTRMIQLVRNLGFPTSEKVESEVIRIRFPTSIDPVSIAEFQDRWAFTPD